MTAWTRSIGSPEYIFQTDTNWNVVLRLNPRLIAGGGEAWLRIFRIQAQLAYVRISLSATETGEPSAAGPQFTDLFETDGTITLTAAGETLVLHGPAHPDNPFLDSSEPYFYIVQNQSEMVAWNTELIAASDRETIVTFDDGVAVPYIAASMSAGTPTLSAAFGVVEPEIRPIAASMSAGAPTLSAAFGVVEPEIRPIGASMSAGAPTLSAAFGRALRLSDFDQTGLGIDALALLRASGDEIQDRIFYADPDRGGSDSPLEGELGLGDSDTLISRIRLRTNNTQLLLNDNDNPDPLSLSAYFGPGGPGENLELLVQTGRSIADRVIFPIAENVTNIGSHFIRFDIPVDARPLITGIEPGARFIFGLVRLGPLVIRAELSSGTPTLSAAFGVVEPDIRPIGASLVSGAPTLSAAFGVVEPEARPIAASLSAGAPTLSAAFGVVEPDIRPIAASLVSGTPALSAAVTVDVPLVQSDLWKRAARALSPARVLLVAVEITHPASPNPVRAVNDTRDQTIEGNLFPAIRFNLRLASDVENQPPRAEIWIDNVGHVLTDWINLTQGGQGATVRSLSVSVDPDAPGSDPVVDWEQSLQIQSISVDHFRATGRIGVPNYRNRAAVIARYDPDRAPGLY